MAGDVGALAGKLDEEGLEGFASGFDVDSEIQKVFEWVGGKYDVANPDDVDFGRTSLSTALTLESVYDSLIPLHLTINTGDFTIPSGFFA